MYTKLEHQLVGGLRPGVKRVCSFLNLKGLVLPKVPASKLLFCKPVCRKSQPPNFSLARQCKFTLDSTSNGAQRDRGKSGIRMDWMRRLRMALDAARGLVYLHELANPPIIQRDVKPSNILLDENLSAKVADFGKAYPMPHAPACGKGYVDPEYYMTQQLTQKSDVYSFGIVVLELITGRKPIERGKNIVWEVKEAMENASDLSKLLEILDPAMGWATSLVCLEKFLDLAMSCVGEISRSRPKMGEVVREIENIIQEAGSNLNSKFVICLLFISTLFLVATAQTNTQDFAALEALKDAWTNIPPNWGGLDPCGSSWVGIHCNNSRITSIILPSMGLIGQLTGDIGQLSELQMLDLSYNSGLTGSLPQSIGNLTKLTTLALEGCGFYGPIPGTVGYMQQLRFLYLSSNSFSGSIPSSIGNLSNLYWLDLSVNNLSGPIPVSSGNTPGLDMLVNTKHFHFGNNQLSGAIPASLFNSSMTLIHVLFESNQLNGSIPSTLALVLSLEVVNLINVNVLYLSNNQLTGPIPNLSGMNELYNVDLSNNTFDASLFP
ncbi:hypothetical protein RHSIM_Rhsim11G0113100 [Rhododendron simsii]|uniref:non-specific serine/threonine protein kinase n=1 Tax=Rhododendron simsii TaxID=118357 RepID=A0A834G6E7_RHOSS|nr:hypothetical protein RHSIM_Rhsim11G0113100 [Rhododendron simsii]